ncbi:MAG: DUF1614 domain-containing protein [Thermincolia bacterium]
MLGSTILLIVGVMIYFGLAQRVLDRLRLTDKGALGVIALMIIGSFIDIPITTGGIRGSINVGGGLIPIVLALYLLIKAGTTWEKVRTLLASVVTGGVIYFLGTVVMTGHQDELVIDPLYLFPLVAGIVAYVIGRTRRGAFVAAILGVLSLDVSNFFWLRGMEIPGRVNVGGAGAFDGVVIAGILAVLLAEFIGEFRERLQGGPRVGKRPGNLLQNLKNIEYANALGARGKKGEGPNEDNQ